MTFSDIVPDLKATLPNLRGRLLANEPLAPLTWFRVGGPAQALFMPEDEADLAYCARESPARIPRHRDRRRLQPHRARWRRTGRRDPARSRLQRDHGGGPPRPRRCRGARLRVAKAAAEAGIAGLAFLRGIPGAIGGALRMNAGAYGRETKDVLVQAHASRGGDVPLFPQCRYGLHLPSLRSARGLIFTEAVFRRNEGRARRHRRRD